MNRLVMLHGKLGVGKDAFADVLVDKHRYSARFFAEPIRKGLLALNPLVEVNYPHSTGKRYVRLAELVEELGWDDSKKIPEVRRLMQTYGTEAGRDIHGDDCWIDIMEQTLDMCLFTDVPVVIKDLRFANELDAGYSWEFNKPELKDGVAFVKIVGESRRESTAFAKNHSSENELEDWRFDYVVNNNGSLDDLSWSASLIATSMPPKNTTRIDCLSRSLTKDVS